MVSFPSIFEFPRPRAGSPLGAITRMISFFDLMFQSGFGPFFSFFYNPSDHFDLFLHWQIPMNCFFGAGPYEHPDQLSVSRVHHPMASRLFFSVSRRSPLWNFCLARDFRRTIALLIHHFRNRHAHNPIELLSVVFFPTCGQPP